MPLNMTLAAAMLFLLTGSTTYPTRLGSVTEGIRLFQRQAAV